MSKQPNTLVVRHKHLKINIGLDPETTLKLNELQRQLVETGMKKPSASLMVRHALRQLHENFDRLPLGLHVDRLKALS